MKRLIFLFPVYLLILSCMPCADIDDSMYMDQSYITNASTPDDNQAAETCSPFCSCNCCGQRIVNLKTFKVISNTTLTANTKQTRLQSFSLQNVLQHIWQPPQLV